MKHNRLDKPLIVITGAAGFIGSGVVRHLNNKGIKNLLLVDDIKDSEKWKNLVGKEFVDLISRYKIFDFLQGREKEIQAFIHLGACSNTLEKDGDYLLDNNYRFSVRLAEYALKNNQRFIYASSAATYGDGSLGFTDEHSLLYKLFPLNLYGYSKHLFDLWLQRENLLGRTVGLKYFNVFGPNEYHKKEMSSMIYKMAGKVQKEGIIHLFKSTEPDKYADGEQVRDFIYVKDAARMTADFLEDENKEKNGIFNIGRGQVVTWNALANALFKALKRKPNIQYIEMSPDLAKQYQNYTCADMKKYFQFHQKTHKFMGIEEAVDDYVNQYLLRNARW